MGNRGSKTVLTRDRFDVEIPNQKPVTLCVRRITGTNATVDAVFKLREEW